jgi:hypothetical protein
MSAERDAHQGCIAPEREEVGIVGVTAQAELELKLRLAGETIAGLTRSVTEFRLRAEFVRLSHLGKTAAHLHIIASQVFQRAIPHCLVAVPGAPEAEKQSADQHARTYHVLGPNGAWNWMTCDRLIANPDSRRNTSFDRLDRPPPVCR